MFKKLKENKILKAIYNICYWILFVFTVAILLVVLMQRFTDNTVSLGGFRIFNVVTESMMPKYEVGDVLLSKTIDTNEIKVGDDIVYEGKEGDFLGKIVTHQVIDIENVDGEYIFHTKGLANEIEDPVITGDQIYGRVIYKIQSLSFVSKIINNLYSFYFIIFVPVAILVFIEVRRIVLRIKNKGIEDEESDEEEQEGEDDVNTSDNNIENDKDNGNQNENDKANLTNKNTEDKE